MTVQSGPHSSDDVREEGFDHYRDDYHPPTHWRTVEHNPFYAPAATPIVEDDFTNDFTSVLRPDDPDQWGELRPDVIDCVEFLRSLHRPIDPAVAALPPVEAAPFERQAIEWEYKIVRAKQPIFGNPATFAQLCREEALAGWILLEKFDNRRVRFKRPLHLREDLDPSALPFDPYRTHYRPHWQPRWGLGVAALLAAAAIPAYAGYTWVSVQLLGPWREDLPRPAERNSPSPPPLTLPGESVHELPDSQAPIPPPANRSATLEQPTWLGP